VLDCSKIVVRNRADTAGGGGRCSHDKEKKSRCIKRQWTEGGSCYVHHACSVLLIKSDAQRGAGACTGPGCKSWQRQLLHFFDSGYTHTQQTRGQPLSDKNPSDLHTCAQPEFSLGLLCALLVWRLQLGCPSHALDLKVWFCTAPREMHGTVVQTRYALAGHKAGLFFRCFQLVLAHGAAAPLSAPLTRAPRSRPRAHPPRAPPPRPPCTCAAGRP